MKYRWFLCYRLNLYEISFASVGQMFFLPPLASCSPFLRSLGAAAGLLVTPLPSDLTKSVEGATLAANFPTIMAAKGAHFVQTFVHEPRKIA